MYFLDLQKPVAQAGVLCRELLINLPSCEANVISRFKFASLNGKRNYSEKSRL
jgi:hypothetical protein